MTKTDQVEISRELLSQVYSVLEEYRHGRRRNQSNSEVEAEAKLMDDLWDILVPDWPRI